MTDTPFGGESASGRRTDADCRCSPSMGPSAASDWLAMQLLTTPVVKNIGGGGQRRLRQR
ncbi:hypothetical protein LC1Hm_1558 [Halomicrobium sp. LC1Hm]|nr:hypothetical protein LC1Hm_1558 [Halomicrobium sp. LC1Hm]